MPVEVLLPTATRVTSLTDTNTTVLNGPTAGTIICTTSALPAGTYEITVNSFITGTPADADIPNMRLVVGGVSISRILNPGTGTPTRATFKVDTTGGAVSVIAVADATAGAKYWAQVITTKVY